MAGRRMPRPRVPYRWRCWTCQAISTSWAAAQRHADSHGGGRIECLFELK